MNTDIEEIKAKIKKLLALSKSPNENEAMIALEKAHKLMKESGLDEVDVKYYRATAVATKRYCRWRMSLANAVAWANGCMAIKDLEKSGTYGFLGTDLGSTVSAEMYTYLAKAVNRETRKLRKNAKAVYRDTFRHAMASRISERIYTDAVSWVADRDCKLNAIRKTVENSITTTSVKPFKAKSRAAYEKGTAAGNSVSLARQAGGDGGRMIGGSSCG